METLKVLQKEYEKNRRHFPKNSVEKEFERLTIEFSWKSSHIEGNTYTLLETERLLKDHEEAKGHRPHEARMILNHKEALDYIRKHREDYRKLTVKKIEDIHSLLTHGLSVSKGIRKKPVSIIGTCYRPHRLYPAI